MNADLAKLTASLQSHEGLRLFVYDDATGAPIKPGTAVKGHPTVGWGRALDTYGVNEAEADYLLANNIDVVVAEVTAALPWVVQTLMTYGLGFCWRWPSRWVSLGCWSFMTRFDAFKQVSGLSLLQRCSIPSGLVRHRRALKYFLK